MDSLSKMKSFKELNLNEMVNTNGGAEHQECLKIWVTSAMGTAIADREYVDDTAGKAPIQTS